jgi:hypothetical protein
VRNELTPRWMMVKAALFVLLGGLAATFLLWQHPSMATAACVASLVWASARAYYFAFHVLQHWIEPGFRFTGLLDLLRHRWRRAKRP